VTALSHGLDDSSTDPSIFACILNDFSGTRNILRLVRRLVWTGDQSSLDNIVHDNDSPFSASLDSVIEVVPIVWFVCIHIDHVEFGQLSSIDVGEHSGKCLHTRSFVNGDSISESGIGDVLSRNFDMMGIVLQSCNFEIGVLGGEPDTSVATQSTHFEAVLCIDGFGLEGEELGKGARGVDIRQILVQRVVERILEDGTVVCGGRIEVRESVEVGGYPCRTRSRTADAFALHGGLLFLVIYHVDGLVVRMGDRCL
jgi:hypothetical protein